ncbi:PEP-CTERM sorting domain-containing protein [Persicirhabdus sediminis]|uniref:PEP-CTERM sorting domain-containing protein n=1 Tax=Persicirhabdus sediminis TaxID=454144 RepID=A0A8J7MC48_9BACT|nr:PEP-CTERM sorting domain-containing protein [Persicirhabdus sediminis]MBK1790727.1 PEP-CTERM sorting domain-containing protein [Persicirhabdus sediminis]
MKKTTLLSMLYGASIIGASAANLSLDLSDGNSIDWHDASWLNDGNSAGWSDNSDATITNSAGATTRLSFSQDVTVNNLHFDKIGDTKQVHAFTGSNGATFTVNGELTSNLGDKIAFNGIGTQLGGSGTISGAEVHLNNNTMLASNSNLTVAAGGILRIAQSAKFNGAALGLNGGTLKISSTLASDSLSALRGNGNIELDGGTGSNTVITMSLNIGANADGSGVGRMYVDNKNTGPGNAGRYTFQLAGVNEFDLTKIGDTLDSDQFIGTDDASFTLVYGGELLLKINEDIAGTDLELGDTFKLFDVANSSGDFDSINDGGYLASINENWGWEFDPTTGELKVIEIPEPSSAALLGLAGVAMIMRRRNTRA